MWKESFIKNHELKLEKAFCDDVLMGRKCFEVRRNDRGFQTGDRVKFFPVDGPFALNHEVKNKVYEITYVLSGHGIDPEFVVFGIKEI